MLELTQPVLNEVFPHGACSAIRHDLKERGAFTPAEAISQQRSLVLRVSLLGCFKSCHAGVGELLNGNLWCREERCCLRPDGFVEGEGVGEEAIRATQTEVMLQNAFAAQSIEVECTCERLWVCAYGLREEDDGVAFGDVKAFEHGVGEDVAGDLPAVMRQVAVVGEGVHAGAWAACC